MGDGRTQHCKTGILPPKELCSCDQFSNKEFGIRKQEIKLTICALNAELEEEKKMLAYNQPLLSLCAQLSKLNSINKKPPSMSADRIYTMDQVVIPKPPPEAIYI